MCGINGIIPSGQSDAPWLRSKISIMNDYIIHRGPDDDGTFVHDENGYCIAMGMRRLSIIDLKSGTQPIYSADRNQVIVFNGEIYNYKDLRGELTGKGVEFKTHSDTEVILQLYKTYGTSGFRKLDGMYAFSIYDKTINKLFIGRDYFGEKPLYFTDSKDGFIWASELKSLLKASSFSFPICRKGLNLFFKLTYIPAPFTIFDGVKKLRPNHLLVYDLENKEYEIEEIQQQSGKEQNADSLEVAKTRVKDLVNESVISRSVSDVPIGTFLSGGVDSSIVSLCLARMNQDKINTFSIGFDNKGYDETDKSRLVADLIGSQHREFVLKESDLEANIDQILRNFDEPFADSSSLPSYLVAHQTAKHVKVALTGDGGDEVFGGYNKYYMGKINKRYTQIVPKPVHKVVSKIITTNLSTKKDVRGFRFKLNRLLRAIDYSDSYYWDIISLGFAGETLSPLLQTEFRDLEVFDYYKEKTGYNSPNSLHEYREVDRQLSLEGDMLVKVDRTSMLSSLECRAPFLNKKIWEYVNSLPENFLLNGWNKKFILKEAFKEEFPDGFLDRSKSGFGVPIGDWLRSSLKPKLLKYAEESYIEKQGIFNKDFVMKLVGEHLNGKDHTFRVWTYYCFQEWYSNYYFGSASA